MPFWWRIARIEEVEDPQDDQNEQCAEAKVVNDQSDEPRGEGRFGQGSEFLRCT
jgi:hypothetical protein